MAFLYHAVPHDMRGGVICPLRKLRLRHQDLWEKHMSKYEDRQRPEETTVSLLDCAFDEVINLTPVHPQKTRNALRRAGIPWSVLTYYEIPVSMFNPDNAVMMYWARGNLVFEQFGLVPIDRYSEIPFETIDYYKKCSPEAPFLQQFVPHVLYRGQLNITGLRIVEGR